MKYRTVYVYLQWLAERWRMSWFVRQNRLCDGVWASITANGRRNEPCLTTHSDERAWLSDARHCLVDLAPHIIAHMHAIRRQMFLLLLLLLLLLAPHSKPQPNTAVLAQLNSRYLPSSSSSSYLFHDYQKGTSQLNWLP